MPSTALHTALDVLSHGTVIPARPLAPDAGGALDERRQRALTRYYLAWGAGGIAVGVHTTQFEIRDPGIDLLRPVLELAADRAQGGGPSRDVLGCIAGVHEVLRRQGLVNGIWCLDPDEALSPGQAEEITRVTAAYPWLTDEAFVAEHVDDWLA